MASISSMVSSAWIAQASVCAMCSACGVQHLAADQAAGVAVAVDAQDAVVDILHQRAALAREIDRADSRAVGVEIGKAHTRGRHLRRCECDSERRGLVSRSG